MYENYTERSRRIMFFAQEEAAQRRHNAVAAEHILLVALRETDTVCCRILDRIGVSIKNLRREINAHIAGGEPTNGSEITLADSAQRVIDYAGEAAKQLANPYIRTEHLLLGLIREGMDNGRELTGRVLRNAGVDLERVWSEVLALQDNADGSAVQQQNTRQQQDTPPLPPENSFASAAQALASSRFAGAMFSREFQKLSPQQQADMQANGLPPGELSPLLQKLLRFSSQTAQAADTNNVLTVLNSTDLLRVQVEPLNTGTRYSVVSSVTLVTTLLVRDDA